MDLFNILSNGAVAVLVGVATGYFASRQVLKRSSKEKLWTETRTAYIEAIESLEELLHWSEYTIAIHHCLPAIEGEVKYYEPLRTISKLSHTGSLVFSTEFHKVLKQANTEIHDTIFENEEASMGDYGDERKMAEWLVILANKIREILEKCLPKLIDIAHKPHSCINPIIFKI